MCNQAAQVQGLADIDDSFIIALGNI